MLELGNKEQIRKAVSGKTGFEPEFEEELVVRIAGIELEQDTYEPLSKTAAGGLVAFGIIGVILAIVSLIV